ncbi:LysR family transcriptional regulator [Streptomyces noursei]|uniref:LysR family transcriptional regulator n=1 Tax=Streptomyces noursei TaxID=1971 RepID=A0A401R1E1_STRNR|nr:LysR family transcriptional regulator [Streptomyces noursei]
MNGDRGVPNDADTPAADGPDPHDADTHAPDQLADPVLDGIELRHLRGFLAVAEERSFTHAADRLRTGQPALTRAVRALEAALGVRLLDRTTRRVALTDAGRRLYADLAPLLPRLAAALRSPAGPGTLRLGFTSLLPAAGGTLITEFKAATGAKVRLVRRDTPLAGLETGESDVAVLRGDVPPDAGLRTALLFQEPRVAAVPRTAAPGAWPAGGCWTGPNSRSCRWSSTPSPAPPGPNCGPPADAPDSPAPRATSTSGWRRSRPATGSAWPRRGWPSATRTPRSATSG